MNSMNYFERNENWEVIYSITSGKVLLNRDLAMYQIEFGNMLMNFYENQFNDFLQFIFERDMTDICGCKQCASDKIIIQAQGSMSCYTFTDVEFYTLQLVLKEALIILKLMQEVKRILN